MERRHAAALLVSAFAVPGGCATQAERSSKFLRECRLGEPITKVSQALGGITFDSCEAGSGLYPYWTLRGHIGDVGVALGAAGPPELRVPLASLDELKYIGHFSVQDGEWTSVRWAYTDGLVQDSHGIE